MGRRPCCEKKGLKKGQWTAEEDEMLVNYITKHGHTNWRSMPQLAGLSRCGKSCRLRWTNYLRPDIKRGPFTAEEETLVIKLHAVLGNRWAAIASHLRGRTDNEIKNLWNTHLRKRLIYMGIGPRTHEPTCHKAQWESAARVEAEASLSQELCHNGTENESSSNTESDYFLRIWNSEAGKCFRNLKTTPEKPSCDSPVSQASSSTTKCGSVYAPTKLAYSNNEHECKVLKPNKEDGITGSYSTVSKEMDEDSSESALQLLLDFPVGSNEMNFLEDNINGYFNLHLYTHN